VLKRIHTAPIPPAISRHIRQERYTTRWRDAVKMVMVDIEDNVYTDPVAADLAVFLRDKRRETLALIERADQLVQIVQTHAPKLIVCHADLHAGNFLIGSDGAFYIVDWDTLVLAPKERDLMYVGAGLMAGWRTPVEEEALFFLGYGEGQIDRAALAYYRFERIIEDIAIYCEQILLTDEGGDDRAQSLYYLKSNYRPGGTIALAYKAASVL
jgi:spectinomycin phosphotransferase